MPSCDAASSMIALRSPDGESTADAAIAPAAPTATRSAAPIVPAANVALRRLVMDANDNTDT
jgi:hypothetical protein